MGKPAKKYSVPTLEERLDTILEEIEAYIESRVDEIKNSPTGANLPRGVLRQTLVGRYGRCNCAAYRGLTGTK